MAKITIYQKPTCTTCKKVYAALKESGVDFNDVNYYIEPLSTSKIKELLAKMGLSARELLRARETVYKDLGLANSEHTEAELIGLMANNPDLIQRPIVEVGAKAILARPAEKLSEIL